MYGLTFGRATSQGAESGNSLLLPYRKLHMTSGLLLFVSLDSNRLLRNKYTVSHFKEPLPPRVQNDLKEKREKNLKHNRKMMQDNPYTVMVESKRNNGKWHEVNVITFSCSCREREFTHRPCQHSIMVSDYRNCDPTHLYNDIERSSRWKEQYQGVSDKKVISLTIEHLKELGRAKSYQPAIVVRKPKGHPKKHKRYLSFEEKEKKTCLKKQKILGEQSQSQEIKM